MVRTGEPMPTEWRAVCSPESQRGRPIIGYTHVSREGADSHLGRLRTTMAEENDEGPSWLESREVTPWAEVPATRAISGNAEDPS